MRERESERVSESNENELVGDGSDGCQSGVIEAW